MSWLSEDKKMASETKKKEHRTRKTIDGAVNSIRHLTIRREQKHTKTMKEKVDHSFPPLTRPGAGFYMQGWTIR